MTEWLDAAAGRLGGHALDEEEAAALLELARVAAHESGDRTNAPLVCYLVGLAHARDGGRPLADLARVAVGGTDSSS